MTQMKSTSTPKWSFREAMKAQYRKEKHITCDTHSAHFYSFLSAVVALLFSLAPSVFVQCYTEKKKIKRYQFWPVQSAWTVNMGFEQKETNIVTAISLNNWLLPLKRLHVKVKKYSTRGAAQTSWSMISIDQNIMLRRWSVYSNLTCFLLISAEHSSTCKVVLQKQLACACGWCGRRSICLSLCASQSHPNKMMM